MSEVKSKESANICILGGTGSVGRILLGMSEDVTVFSRGEYEQYKLKKKYPKTQFVLGDIRDRSALRSVTRGMDIVFHLAALKHVSSGETDPIEVVKTNVEGTNNVIDACKFNGVKLLVYMSTDKSVHPVNTYGCSKLIAEKMVMNNRGQDYLIIRSGNLLVSRGSVIPEFFEAKRRGEILKLTDKRMSRYFVKNKILRNIFSYILDGHIQKNITIIPKMVNIKILDIVKKLKCDYEVIGKQTGEKLKEVLVWDQEKLEDKGNYYIIRKEGNDDK